MGHVLVVVNRAARGCIAMLLGPGVRVVSPGAPLAGSRYARVIVHGPARVPQWPDPEAAAVRRGWFDELATRLPVGGTLSVVQTLPEVVAEALAWAPDDAPVLA